jgi:peptidoglycan/LPS O-acetylase OafA/YrhL
MFLGLNVLSGHLFFASNFRETSPQLYQFLFIPQAWTIGVEISFYFIAPFLVRKKLITIITLILLSLILRFFLSHYGFKDDPWSYRFFPTELVFFLLGIISYHIYKVINQLKIEQEYLKSIWFIVVGFTIFFSFLPIPYKYPIYLLLFFVCLPFVFILTKNWKLDAYIGELSYPIYISHIFVLDSINALKIPMVFELGLSLVILTIMFSIVLNELVAKRIETIRQKRIKKPT